MPNQRRSKMGDISLNLNKSEIACKCGCNTTIINNSLVSLWQAIRTDLGGRIKILSWCRCKKHNQAVGGAPKSFHLIGWAIDMTPLDNTLAELHRACERHNPHGLGIYSDEGMIHIDMGLRYQRWIKKGVVYYYAFPPSPLGPKQ